jgi:acetyl esterase
MSEHTVEAPSGSIADNKGHSVKHAEVPYSRLSHVDRQFLDALSDFPHLGTLSVEEERARMRAGQAAAMEDYPVEPSEYHTSACSVHLIRPIGAGKSAPILFFLHGGGWVLGDLRTHMKLVCELAVLTQSVVAFVEYPRAPEHPFPAPLEACITALYEVLEAAESLELDRNRFSIVGDSSGGNLTAALILSAIERNLPLPSRQVLLYPVTDRDWTTASYQEFWGNLNLSQLTMKWFWDNYLPESSLNSDPHALPLQAGSELLSQFPPTLLITCEYDVLREEGEQLAARLIAAGVDVTAVRWLGALHGFLVTESLAASPSAQTCIDMVARYIRGAFDQS